ncbi:MAG: hypothetical protein K0R47_1641 [Brevibacillus sp.]|jgi:hypothetical protein|nr:hypothetical protein [Brevibacillus sp.]
MNKIHPRRSYCPINLSIEVFGDSWSLLILWDIVYFCKKTYVYVMRVFQCNADEAKVRIVERLFRSDLRVYGEDTHQNFLNAYDELTLATATCASIN